VRALKYRWAQTVSRQVKSTCIVMTTHRIVWFHSECVYARVTDSRKDYEGEKKGRSRGLFQSTKLALAWRNLEQLKRPKCGQSVNYYDRKCTYNTDARSHLCILHSIHRSHTFDCLCSFCLHYTYRSHITSTLHLAETFGTAKLINTTWYTICGAWGSVVVKALRC
jgi:hypothetical protein